jgi:methyl-accepting chemotaxis protein
MLILGAITWIATHTTSLVLAEETGNNLNSLAHVQALAAGDLMARQIDIIQALSGNTVLVEAVSRQNNTYNDNPARIEAALTELDRIWVNSLADGPLIRTVLNNEAAVELKNFQKQFPNHVEIFVTDQRGALLAATNRVSDYYQADEPWWQQAYQQGQGAVFLDRLAFDESSNTFGIKMAVPIYHPQTAQLVGILQTVYRIGHFNNLIISPVSNQAGVLIDLLLPDGQLIARDGTGLTPLAPDTLAQLQSSAGQPYAALTFEGVPRLVSQAPVASLTGEAAIESLAWRIIVSQNEEIVLAALASQQRMILGMALLAAGLAALMAVTIASWLAQPITRLTEITRQIGDGNLSIEAPVSSNDEIGRLALTFNYMTARLRQLIGSL